MNIARKDIPQVVSNLLDGRPTRWAGSVSVAANPFFLQVRGNTRLKRPITAELSIR